MKDDKPFFSVIMPVYNYGEVLKKIDRVITITNICKLGVDCC